MQLLFNILWTIMLLYIAYGVSEQNSSLDVQILNIRSLRYELSKLLADSHAENGPDGLDSGDKE